jgi:hypothetical protein
MRRDWRCEQVFEPAFASGTTCSLPPYGGEVERGVQNESQPEYTSLPDPPHKEGANNEPLHA